MYTVSIHEGRYGVAGKNICVDDVTTSRAEADELVDLLNRNDASELHLFDIIEDWFGR